MSAELGQILLILALAAALYQAVFPLAGAHVRDFQLIAAARPAALAQAALVAAAFAALLWVHASSDFSVRNVVENSHSAKPMIYKLSGAWGNHEGSMLLWALILALYGGALAAFAKPTELRARALGIQGLLAAAFLGFILFTSNPFERLFPAPADGRDLNPLLQDPGLALHPPFLYLGYVGFSIVFAYALAGLIAGRIDEAWAREVRPWALAAWTFLTIGIALGSWWAYYELGWGGFWAWDPVENASFMPWLAGVALIHSIRVLEVRGALKSWTALLAILTFSLSLIGTFLVRSGVLTSVHAFAVDPARGVYILAILGLAIGGALMLFALRGPALSSSAGYAPVSREGAILINNVILAAACGTVFIGTFYPLFAEVVSGEKLSVGAPYFNMAFLPFMALVLLIAGPASALAWKRGDAKGALYALWPAFLAGFSALGLALWLAWPKPVAAAFGAGLSVWAGAAAIVALQRRARLFEGGWRARLASLPRSFVAMSIAHLGFAIAALGIIGTGVWKSETIAYVKEGETISVGDFGARLLSVEQGEGPNYVAETATFAIGQKGAANVANDATLAAERRFYPVRGVQTTEAAIRTSLTGDLYLALGDFHPERGWVVRAWTHPLAIWMWIGAGLMAAGGAIAARGEPARLAAGRERGAPLPFAEKDRGLRGPAKGAPA